MLTARLGRVSVTGRRNPCMMPTAPEVLKAPTLLVDLRAVYLELYTTGLIPAETIPRLLKLEAELW
jgi:hypothetical protein